MDCKTSVFGLAERSVFSESGNVKYHYMWSPPEFLDLSSAPKVSPNSVDSLLQYIACHDDVRRPLVTRAELTSMAFTALSSTADGKGDMFYKTARTAETANSTRDVIVVTKENNEHSIPNELFPGKLILGLPPSYRKFVERVTLDCAATKLTFLKVEYYDDRDNLVDLVTIPSPVPIAVPISSPMGLLYRIVCSGS